MKSSIRFQLNGQPTALEVDGARMLLWVLRGELGLTGAKYGCGEGVCGACTVLVDGAAVHACTTPVSAVAGKRVVTIEGLAAGERLHPLQEAFVEHGALQCGYCTPGMILAAHALLAEHPHATRAQILAGLEDHLCRCGAHQRIVAAVEQVAAGKGGAS
ncbi:MAG: (2Fe-2S)-binding protein [Thermoanaerobaculia bacterium]|nr:MAG: (2Fe-2S)-binding protein [Thermoanaerobaculia bacterium]